MLKKLALGLLGALILVFVFLYAVGRGLFGSHEDPGTVTKTARPAAAVEAARVASHAGAEGIGASTAKQILFGDLHVHTTFSFDAFMISLPLAQGEGAHPPADACDFARFCSALDFWSINDHSEGITPQHWRETVDSIRECNEVAGDPANPDTVAFLGWEWTDVGMTPDDHYGHKNVVMKYTDDARIPTRPIAATSTVRRTREATRFPVAGLGAALLFEGKSRFHDLARYFGERGDFTECPTDVHVRDLPNDCLETAETPAVLYRKLDEWGHDSIVIPHGTTWGMYTPPGSTWEKQLQGPMHDPDRQTLFEIYSGHGNSDVYQDWRAVEFDIDGTAVCPEPTANYLPSCWRAGQIIHERCTADGEAPSECEARAVETRARAAAAGVQAHFTVPGVPAADWLDAGQCRDCDEPSFNYRPGGSAQYVMALGNFDEPANPRHFRFGFMSSSDNHFARPGTGYKEVNRVGYTESRPGGRIAAGFLTSYLTPSPEKPASRSKPFDLETTTARGFALFEFERQSSFFTTGGLIAAHSSGRDRESVWDAMDRREVYGTSGPRILLWFDLLNPPGTRGRPVPMGGEAKMRENPIFQVRAAGSFEQLPGCPDYAGNALGAERIEHVCKGECYHPSDRRRTITRIEVVRIRPQTRPDEPIASLIEDPWRSFDCEPDPEGCAVSFSDPDYQAGRRNAVYYVRAFETPSPAINAGGVRCEYDAAGACLKADLCDEPDSDCLSPHEPKAWSSPIFVDWPNERNLALAPQHPVEAD